MENISAKLSSKNQITVPKTVRDYLGVSENSSVQFVFETGRVYLEKGIEMQVCPFCYGEDFYGEPCLFCDGEGVVEADYEDRITSKLVDIFLDTYHGRGFHFRNVGFFTQIGVLSDDLQQRRYREHFQMEYIKKSLRKYKMKILLDKELQENLANMFEFEDSRKNFVRWWDTLIDTHTK